MLDSHQWFALGYFVVGLGLIVAVSLPRAPRIVRIIAGIVAIALATFLLVDDYFDLSLIPGGWGWSAAGLLGISVGALWRIRRTPAPD